MDGAVMKVSDREALSGHCANVWQLATSATMSFFFGPPNPRLPLVEGNAIYQSTLNGRSWPIAAKPTLVMQSCISENHGVNAPVARERIA